MTNYLHIRIELGNDEMRTPAHAADMLVAIAKRIRSEAPTDLGPTIPHRLRDVNGNTVGSWQVAEEP